MAASCDYVNHTQRVPTSAIVAYEQRSLMRGRTVASCAREERSERRRGQWALSGRRRDAEPIRKWLRNVSLSRCRRFVVVFCEIFI